jgi:hypothetical protein
MRHLAGGAGLGASGPAALVRLRRSLAESGTSAARGLLKSRRGRARRRVCGQGHQVRTPATPPPKAHAHASAARPTCTPCSCTCPRRSRPRRRTPSRRRTWPCTARRSRRRPRRRPSLRCRTSAAGRTCRPRRCRCGSLWPKCRPARPQTRAEGWAVGARDHEERGGVPGLYLLRPDQQTAAAQPPQKIWARIWTHAATGPRAGLRHPSLRQGLVGGPRVQAAARPRVQAARPEPPPAARARLAVGQQLCARRRGQAERGHGSRGEWRFRRPDGHGKDVLRESPPNQPRVAAAAPRCHRRILTRSSPTPRPTHAPRPSPSRAVARHAAPVNAARTAERSGAVSQGCCRRLPLR